MKIDKKNLKKIIKSIIKEQILIEDYYYKEDPLFKDSDVYDYVPTQAEIDAFKKDELGHKQYQPPQPTKTLKPKEKKIKKYTGNSYLRRLSSTIDYGKTGLMMWKLNNYRNNEPVLGKTVTIHHELTPEYKEYLKQNKEVVSETKEQQQNFILYRGVGLTEAIESCKLGYLKYYSKDPMSRDWEIIEYGLGEQANNMSEQEIEIYINDLVDWEPKNKGVNLTSDLQNAMGYSDIVLEITATSNYVAFSDVHYFAQNPKNCLVISVYYKNKKYTPQEFLNLVGNNKLNETKQLIKSLVTEEIKKIKK